MPATKKAPKLEVILPTAKAMKHVVKFDTDEKGVALTNVYIGLDGMRQLNNPRDVKVTIEAYEA
jgi:hypothetical protein